ncbi:MAG: hypothetical protein AAGK22_20715 [Acidobacteriota bacterium]
MGDAAISFHADGQREARRFDAPRTGLRARRLRARHLRESVGLRGFSRLKAWWRTERLAFEAERREERAHAPTDALY